MAASISKETVRLAREIVVIIEVGLDNPTINKNSLVHALGKLADIIVLNTEEE